MKILDIETRTVSAELRNWIFVKVITDQGLVGWGEATLEWKTRAVVGCIEDLKPLLLGQDPRRITHLNEMMTKHSFWRLGAIGRSAISGIDIALWDILGKSLGAPIYQLLGGRVRDRVRMYTHLGMGQSDAVYGTGEVRRLQEQAAAVVEQGWNAIKVVFLPYMNHTVSNRQVDHTATLMRGVRETVGDDVEVMVDFHGRCANGSAALALIRAIEPFRPMFVEEPLPPGEVTALRWLHDRVEVPIATGERLLQASDFDPLLSERALDIAQPDLCHCGGFTEASRIGTAAHTAGVGLAPHNPLGPIAGVAALHFDAATPNFVIQEKMEAVPWFFEVVENQPAMEDGHWLLPSGPGLGVEVNEAAAAQHPYEPEPVSVIQEATLNDGTVVNW